MFFFAAATCPGSCPLACAPSCEFSCCSPYAAQPAAPVPQQPFPYGAQPAAPVPQQPFPYGAVPVNPMVSNAMYFHKTKPFRVREQILRA